MNETQKNASVGYLALINDSAGLAMSLYMGQTIPQEWEQYHCDVHKLLPPDCLASVRNLLVADGSQTISEQDAPAADLFVKIGAAMLLGNEKVGPFGITPTLAGFALCATVMVTDVFRVCETSYMDRIVLQMRKLRPNDVP